MHTNGINHPHGLRPGSPGASRLAGGIRRGAPLLLAAAAAVAAVVSVVLFASPAMADRGTAEIRMVHLSPDAPEVFVEVDGEPVEALADISYMDASPYLEVPAGPHDLAVYATADDTAPVLEVEVDPDAGSSYTIAGMGLLSDDTFGAKLLEDDNGAPEDGKSEVRVVHAIPDVGPATVSVADGPDLFTLPGFANASDYREVDPGTYTFDVTPAGAEAPAFSVADVAAREGKVYTAFAIGKAEDETVGTIITDDTDNGKVLLEQGGGKPPETPGPPTLVDTSGAVPSASKTHPQEIQRPTSVVKSADGEEDSKDAKGPTEKK